MSAFAGALGLRLEKHGQYQLNPGGRAAQPQDIGRALRLARWTLLLAVPLLCLGPAAARDPAHA